MPLWAGATDFKTTFDTVTQRHMGRTTTTRRGQWVYRFTAVLVPGQTASVRADRTSAKLEIQRDTKLGDPLSSLLFNSVSEYVIG
eukprot:3868478-Pyramimonas_sp.AAC.1